MILSDLIANIQTELGQAGGPDVQLYAEPRVIRMIQREFNNAFQARFWNRFTTYATYALDGTTGAITTDISALVAEFNDIGNIWFEQYRNPLPLMPKDINPSLVNQICIQPQVTETTHGFFIIRPVTTAGNVVLKFRTKPADFTDNDIVPFDIDYLTCKVVTNFLVMEGTNLKAADFYAKMAKDLWESLIDLDTQNDKELHSSSSSALEQWSTL